MLPLFLTCCLSISQLSFWHFVSQSLNLGSLSHHLASRYRVLKECRDGEHLIASFKVFQTSGPEYEMPILPIDELHFGRANNEEVAFRVP